jgi:predicted transcriptional regulator
MRTGNRPEASTGDKVMKFFAECEGEFSVKQVAEAIGMSPNTVGQALLALCENGDLGRRMEGVARGRHYVYARK